MGTLVNKMAKDIILSKNFIKEEVTIGPGRQALMIAEAGVLTFGHKEMGFKFVDEAARIGIKLLKFQCFVAEHVVSHLDQYWLNRLRQRALGKSDFLEIMNYGKGKGVICFASTHNEYDLVELADAGMPILKIGSGDSNNYRMIDMALATKKPVILSLGLLEKEKAIGLLTKYKKSADQLIVMHSVTLYPTPIDSANLVVIEDFKKLFPEYNFGYSDHVCGYNAALAAVAMLEVSIVEKHLCLPEQRIKPEYESQDIVTALIPDEFGQLLQISSDMHSATKDFRENKEIFGNRHWASKAIYARNKIRKGEIIKPENLTSIRPYRPEEGHISIERFDEVMGRKAKRDIEPQTYLKLQDII